MYSFVLPTVSPCTTATIPLELYLPLQVAVDPATVASLVAITGSPEEAVVQALAAAYGNADVAAEYLMNGNKIQ